MDRKVGVRKRGILMSSSMKGLRILIAEDYEVIRRGIRSMLEDLAGWKVCGEAATIAETIQKTGTLQPDLVLLDVTMPDMDTARAVAQIFNVCPAVKIVALAMQESAELAAKALAAGANGLALKSETAGNFVTTVQNIISNQPFLSPAAVTMIQSQLGRLRAAAATPTGLTSQELGILEAFARGGGDKIEKTASPPHTKGSFTSDLEALAACQPDGERRTGKRNRVLLVEDDPDVRDYLQSLLLPHYNVTAATNSQDALTFASADPPDLVLCDVLTPILQETGLVKALRSDPATSSLPIILLSAQAGEESRHGAGAITAGGYPGQPFTARELLTRVELHLSLSHMRKQEAERTQKTLEAELNGMTRLHEVSSRLLAAPTVHAALEEILFATCTMMGSQMGYLQVYDPRTETLMIAAQQGFSPDSLEQLRHVEHGSSGGGTAVKGGRRVIIEDVNEDESFRPLQAIGAAAGFRSLQSTSLLTRTGTLLGVLSTHWRQPHRPSEHDLYMLDLYAHEAADILDRIQNAQELQRSFHQLRALAAKLQSVREEERKRVAREIHDELGQSLTAIKMELSSLFFEWPGDQKPSKRTASLTNLVDQTIQSVRKIATELRPGILDALGLVAAVEWAASEFEARTGTRCSVHMPKEDLPPDQDRDTAIFRIFQETLTNIARHARATEATIRLTREDDGSLILDVQDNGIGFNEQALDSHEALGILGMRERAVLLGGEFELSGTPNLGTHVRVHIPLPASRQEEQSI